MLVFHEIFSAISLTCQWVQGECLQYHVSYSLGLQSPRASRCLRCLRRDCMGFLDVVTLGSTGTSYGQCSISIKQEHGISSSRHGAQVLRMLATIDIWVRCCLIMLELILSVMWLSLSLLLISPIFFDTWLFLSSRKEWSQPSLHI